MIDNPVLLFVGKSGSGKTTIANYLSAEYGMIQVQSYTTRKPRYAGETGHTFVSFDTYLATDKDDIVAETFFDGNIYWATSEQIDIADIYVIDVFGISKMRNMYRGHRKIAAVFFDVDEATRYSRMILRGDNNDSALQRIDNDNVAFANIDEVLVGLPTITITGADSIECAAGKIMNFMEGLKCETES